MEFQTEIDPNAKFTTSEKIALLSFLLWIPFFVYMVDLFCW